MKLVFSKRVIDLPINSKSRSY